MIVRYEKCQATDSGAHGGQGEARRLAVTGLHRGGIYSACVGAGTHAAPRKGAERTVNNGTFNEGTLETR